MKCSFPCKHQFIFINKIINNSTICYANSFQIITLLLRLLPQVQDIDDFALAKIQTSNSHSLWPDLKFFPLSFFVSFWWCHKNHQLISQWVLLQHGPKESCWYCWHRPLVLLSLLEAQVSPSAVHSQGPGLTPTIVAGWEFTPVSPNSIATAIFLLISLSQKKKKTKSNCCGEICTTKQNAFWWFSLERM